MSMKSDGSADSGLRIWLTRQLGGAGRVSRLRRRPCPYASSFKLQWLDVWLANGRRIHLIFKDLRWDAQLPAARAIKPRFIYDPLREIQMYRGPLSGGELGTAACQAARADAQAGKFWLVLERVRGAQLSHVGDFDLWKESARQLARIHAAFDGRKTRRLGAVPLLGIDADLCGAWARRARRFLRERVPGALRDMPWLGRRHDHFVDRLMALPVGLLHGDFYSNNILIDDSGRRPRVCAVDWELAAWGPGAIDLAALTAGRWSESQRLEMLNAYRGELARRRAVVPSACELREALALGRLYLAGQMLGWSSHWKPRRRQINEWLSQASESARRLGI
jgi:Ser/Thr protein kinase RdoA (MazF antagonist)